MKWVWVSCVGSNTAINSVRDLSITYLLSSTSVSLHIYITRLLPAADFCITTRNLQQRDPYPPCLPPLHMRARALQLLLAAAAASLAAGQVVTASSIFPSGVIVSTVVSSNAAVSNPTVRRANVGILRRLFRKARGARRRARGLRECALQAARARARARGLRGRGEGCVLPKP